MTRLQTGLFNALQRALVHPHLIALVHMLYDRPEFYTEQECYISNHYEQTAGIRQGCPLSPYLSLAIMHTIFHDVHDLMHNTLTKARVKHMLNIMNKAQNNKNE